jgi:hypothetical protein
MERAAAAGDLAFAGHGGDGDAPLIPVRVDGKTVRGARNPDGSQVHLLAALAGRPGVVAAQAEVGAKTDEIPMIIPLLDGMDLDRAVVTADALHLPARHSELPARSRRGLHLAGQDNQPRLFDALDGTPLTTAVGNRSHGAAQLSGRWTAPGAMPDSSPDINDDRPTVRASRSLVSVPAGTRKGVTHHG